MKKYAGVWIDHEKAYVVSLSDSEEAFDFIESNIAGRTRMRGGSRSKTPYGPQDVVSESKREGKYKQQLSRFYREVIRAMDDARKVLIFGPGEAKTELTKAIEKEKGLSTTILAVEPADKMTESQIKAKVKRFFLPK